MQRFPVFHADNQPKRKSAMEIQTTIKAFSEKIGGLDISPETPITVIIQTFRHTGDGDEGKSRLPFLYSGVWDDPDGPEDISENTDYYLYDSGDIHDR
jgi:hypothetical protein